MVQYRRLAARAAHDWVAMTARPLSRITQGNLAVRVHTALAQTASWWNSAAHDRSSNIPHPLVRMVSDSL